MYDLSQLTREALSLPLEERLHLAQELWASLGPPSVTSIDSEVAEVLDKADRRNAELASGSVEGISHADAIARARKSIGCE
jgi:hypothetical protein